MTNSAARSCQRGHRRAHQCNVHAQRDEDEGCAREGGPKAQDCRARSSPARLGPGGDAATAERSVRCHLWNVPETLPRVRGDTAHRKVSLQELCHTRGQEAAQGSCCPPHPCRNPAGEGTDCTEVSFGGVNRAAGSPASRSRTRGRPQQERTVRPEPPPKPAEPPRARTLAFLL